ncbi:hypothetical protein L3V82_01685 [Thiotrichales bacterium 19S3-7]|nr:hypothetical protein [Thiotrichales bacterium 19S3-7]MCF6800875.1 hypothetical protein [Thiotrichales bacterium 19S3-11]
MECDYLSIANNKPTVEVKRHLTVIPTLGNKIQPFYQSTGRNSTIAGTFLPCEGVQETWIKKPNYHRISEEVAKIMLNKEPQLNIKRFGNLENIFISMAFGDGIWLKHPELASDIQNIHPELTKQFQAHFKTEQLVGCIALNNQHVINQESRQTLKNNHRDIQNWLYQQKWHHIKSLFDECDESMLFKKALIALYECGVIPSTEELELLQSNKKLQKSIYLLYDAQGNPHNNFNKKYHQLKRNITLQESLIILDDSDIKRHRGWDKSSNWRRLQSSRSLRKSVKLLQDTPEMLKANWQQLKYDKPLQVAICELNASDIQLLFKTQVKEAPSPFLTQLECQYNTSSEKQALFI